MQSIRSFGVRAWLLHSWLIAGIVLSPVLPLNAEYRMDRQWDDDNATWRYFTYDDANNSGAWEEGEALNEVAENDDPDNDGLSNAEEYICFTSPYNIDSDYDGITDGDEVMLLGGIENGYNPNDWDTNDNGYSDHDEYYGCYSVDYSQMGMGYSYYDWDGDSYKNHEDSHPFDGGLYSDWDYNGYNDGYEPGGSTDSDSDGHYDEYDSHPYDSSLWNDWNYNGVQDDQENGTGDMDNDGDGYYDSYDSHPYDQSLWEDWNGNGINDSSEGTDSDGDGFWDSNDSHPYDASRWLDWGDTGSGSGPTDSDGDSHPDESDSHPYDWTLWSDWDSNGYNEGDGPADSDGDGYLDASDSHPNNNMLWNDLNGNYCNDEYETLDDRDGDGILDEDDSHPDDARYKTDRDYDSLEREFEIAVSMTNPDNADSDGDGLNDGLEYLTLHTNPNQVDSDGDGLTDFEEVNLHPESDPLNAYSRSQAMGMGNSLTDWQMSSMAADTDADGIPDSVEDLYDLNPNDPSDAEGDLDADEITNLQEFQAGTSLWGDADTYDTDQDGITDVAEDIMSISHPGILNKYNPADATEDPDGDGVLNFEEMELDLNPMDADSSTPGLDQHEDAAASPDMVYAQTHGFPGWLMPIADGDNDGDGMPDVWEHYYRVRGGLPGLNLRDSTDWDKDPDGDLLTNRGEVLSYRHPFVADYTANPIGENTYTPGAGTTSAYVPQLPTHLNPGSGKDYNVTHVLGAGDGEPPSEVVKFEVASVEWPADSTPGFLEWGAGRSASASGLGDKAIYPCYPMGDTPVSEGQTCACGSHGLSSCYISKINTIDTSGEVQVAGFETPDTSDDVYEYQNSTEDFYYWDKQLTCPPEEEEPGALGEPHYGRVAIRMRVTTPYPYEIVRQVKVDYHNYGSDVYSVPRYLRIPAGSLYSDEEDAYAAALPQGVSTVTIGYPDDDVDDSFSVSASDSAGPRYRKVGLNGAPISDSKPQVQDEAGEPPEETYIDAYTAELRHSVSDVYVDVEHSLLPLQVRRDLVSSSWSDRYGLQPAENPHQPFGTGWSSNICSYVHFKVDKKGYSAQVVDEMGQQQLYKLSSNLGWLHDRQEFSDVKTFQNEFLATRNGNDFSSIQLSKKFGTTCYYEMVPSVDIKQVISPDRVYGSDDDVEVHTYARLKRVVDRWGNELQYNYIGTSLIPFEISDPKRPGLRLTIEQANGRVVAVCSPNGEVVNYSYQEQTFPSRLTGAEHGATTVLSAVTRGGYAVSYEYTLINEMEIDSEGDVAQHSTIGLSQITDERGGVYSFNYAVNNTIFYFSNKGVFRQYGLPLKLTSVTSPIIGSVAIHNIRVVSPLMSSGRVDYRYAAQPVTTQFAYVSSGQTRTYRYFFTDPVGTTIHGPLDAYEPDSDVVNYSFQRMAIQAPDGGVETFTFLPNANMALGSVRDRTGALTSFAYEDVFRPSNAAQNSPIVYYDDPTREINDLGKVKTMTYDPATRMLLSMTDTRGVKTLYTIDKPGPNQVPPYGRRRSERVSGRGISGGYFETLHYGHALFKGMVTERVLAPNSLDPTKPASDICPTLVTKYSLNPDTSVLGWWCTSTETRTINGQPANTVTVRDFNGNKRSVTDARGFTTCFDYDSRHRLTAIRYPDGSSKTLEYDPHGNLTKEVDETGVTTLHAYDALNRRISTTVDLNGNGVADSRPVDIVQETTYNDMNLPVAKTDPRGVVTRFEYDAIGRLIRTTVNDEETDPLKKAITVVDYKVAGINGGKEAGGSVFDVSGFKPVRITDPEGRVSTFQYDNLHRVVSKSSTDAGTVFTTYATNESADRPATVSHPVDANRKTSFTYDVAGRVTRTLHPDSTVTEQFYTHHGQPWKVVDELGRVTLTKYDSAGHVREVELPEVEGVTAKEKFGYDVAGNAIWKIDTLGRITHTDYDRRNRAVFVTMPAVLDGNDQQIRRPVIETRYDAAGRVTETVDPLGRTTKQFHDHAGRLHETWDALGQITELDLDPAGNVLTTTNPKGQVVTNAYDALGRIETTTDAEGIVNEFEYDRVGNRTKVTDGKGNVTRFVYDGQNRLKEQHFEGSLLASGEADNDSWFYHYNAAVKTGQTDPQGRVTSYTYDLRDRLKSVSTPTSGGVPANVRTYSYDLVGKITQVTESSDPTATVVYTYDARGRLTAEQSRSVIHQYRYDAAGNRTEAEHGDGRKTVTIYDALNRPSQISEGSLLNFNADKSTTTYGYDLAGRALYLVAGNGQVTLNSYDPMGRLSGRVLHQSAPVTAGNKQAEFTWAHDELGNVTEQIEQWFGSGIARLRTTTQVYDDANRLEQETIEETGTQTMTTVYGYDAANNRTTKAVTFSGTGALPSIEAGNWTYTYNAANQLTQTVKRDAPGALVENSVSYVYDAQGNRSSEESFQHQLVPAVAQAQGMSFTAAEVGESGNAIGVSIAEGNPGQPQATASVAGNQVQVSLAMDNGTKAQAQNQGLLYTASEVGTAGNALQVQLENAGPSEVSQVTHNGSVVVARLETDEGQPDVLADQGITYTATHAHGDAPASAVRLVADNPDQEESVSVEGNEIQVQLATDSGDQASALRQGLAYESAAIGTAGNGYRVRFSLNDSGLPLSIGTVNDQITRVLLEQTGGVRAQKALPDIVYQAAEVGTGGEQITVQHVKSTDDTTSATVVGNAVTVHLGQDPGDAATAIWSEGDLTFTAVEPGTAGNNISIEFIDPGVDDVPMSVDVEDNLIQVYLPTSSSEPRISVSGSDLASAILGVAGHLVSVGGTGSGIVSSGGTQITLSGGGENRQIMATAYDVQAALQSDLQASALLEVADFGTGEPLAEGQWQLQGGVDGVVETTTAEVAALFSLGEADGYVTVTGSGDPVEKAQAGEVVLTGGGDNFTVESTPDSVVTLLNSTPAVTERLTASGSGTTVLQALPSTPLSGGVARASVVTAAALVALFQSVPSVAEAMMTEVTGDPAALVQPGQVYLSGGVEPASTSTVNDVVALLNGTPEVTALFQTTGSGETIVGAGSASLSGGGEQATLTGTRTYGWDVHGRLAQVSLPGGQVHSYSYDYRTRRIGLQQTAAGAEPAKTTAVVFSGGLSLAEYESTTAQATIASPGQSTVRYVRGPDMGGGVGGLLYSRRAQAVKFNLSNGRGDIVAQSDASGALTWTASYEAYGKRTKETGENLDKQRGNSKDEDPTGLLNEGFRYRDLETGVWLSRDPAGFVDGPNVYAYVKQNPWTGWDPDGLMTLSELGGHADNWVSGVGQMWAGYGDVTVGAVASAAHAVVSLPSNVNSIAHSLADISTHDLGTLGRAGVGAGKEIGGNIGQAASDFGGRLAQGDERTWGQAVGTALTLGGAKGAQFAKAAPVAEAAEVSASAASTAAKAQQAAAAAAPEVNATRAGGLETRGYKPSPGERTLDGYVKQNAAQREIGLYTDSAAFDFTPGSTQFKRFGADSHAGLSPHVHQPIRNMTPNGPRGTTGTKIKNDGVTKPTQKDVKQLYENLNNGKYNE